MLDMSFFSSDLEGDGILSMDRGDTSASRLTGSCRKQIDGIKRLRRRERIGVAASLQGAVASERQALWRQRTVLASASKDDIDSEDEVEPLLVDWRAKK
jgi:hypothetical protein